MTHVRKSPLLAQGLTQQFTATGMVGRCCWSCSFWCSWRDINCDVSTKVAARFFPPRRHRWRDTRLRSGALNGATLHLTLRSCGPLRPCDGDHDQRENGAQPEQVRGSQAAAAEISLLRIVATSAAPPDRTRSASPQRARSRAARGDRAIPEPAAHRGWVLSTVAIYRRGLHVGKFEVLRIAPCGKTAAWSLRSPSARRVAHSGTTRPPRWRR